MQSNRRCIPTTIITIFGSAMMAVLSLSPQPASAAGYVVTNLVADVEGVARHTDTNLVNPWGLVIAPTGTLIVAVNHSDDAQFFNPDGTRLPITINVPTAPTGVVINHSPQDFLIRNGRIIQFTDLIFATESGTILAARLQQGRSTAVVAVDNSKSGAVYKGLALGTNGMFSQFGTTLYATDFHNGRVDMFNRNFQRTGSFTDPTVPAGFAPFNVQTINGLVLVTFAKQKLPEKMDDQAGLGNGFVDVFTANGSTHVRVASRGALNSPWGMAISPFNFGRFSNALLVGNFGDGHINAFDLRTGAFLGQLKDPSGNPIVIDGLWSLTFARNSSDLFFAAGPADETHGLVGIIRPQR
ncbi:TIGR03118 family protein [Pedosphaera parvula]|uniref:TIGR03118 family protein n=1 Tax=Pedosphaera parvula (strain Ellin514) TaxID=320771 RepID=B9XSY1_PEDPL|nr:TIGR03118 family protein [Pedosphaera parvula]EEF57042.1 conserved hypothetical protein [Pedosphaera parvula Ellin514]